LDGSLEVEIKRSKERFLSIWQESERKSPANPLDHFNLTQRQRKFINYGKISKRNHIEIRLPFTDYDVVDFCLKIPRDLRINDRLCKEMFWRFYPDLARIPQADKGYLKAGRFRARLYRKMNIMKTRLKWKGPLMDYNLYYRKFLRPFVSDVLLKPKFKNRGYFNYPNVEKILNEHFAGTANHKATIGTLITFELWCRFFLDGTPPEFH
jgi:asparagine synthase (glutamine-hydrolysing)